MKFAALALLALLPLSAHAADWKVDMAHSTLGFSGSYQDEAFHGRFKTFDAAIRLDPQQLDQARFDVTVQLGSVDTDNPERDQTLTGEDFFAVTHFPTAHFVTSGFQRAADGSLSARGTLDLHGVAQPVTLKVHFKPDGTQATLDVDTTLDRKSFKLGTAEDWNGISTQIAVHAHLVMTRAQ